MFIFLYTFFSFLFFFHVVTKYDRYPRRPTDLGIIRVLEHRRMYDGRGWICDITGWFLLLGQAGTFYDNGKMRRTLWNNVSRELGRWKI